MTSGDFELTEPWPMRLTLPAVTPAPPRRLTRSVEGEAYARGEYQLGQRHRYQDLPAQAL